MTLRRNNYFEMKRKSKIPKASVALPVLQCNMLFDSENELFYDDPCDTDLTASWPLNDGVELSVPSIAVVAAPTCQRKGMIIAGDTISEFEQNAISVLEGKASMLISPVERVEALPIAL